MAAEMLAVHISSSWRSPSMVPLLRRGHLGGARLVQGDRDDRALARGVGEADSVREGTGVGEGEERSGGHHRDGEEVETSYAPAAPGHRLTRSLPARSSRTSRSLHRLLGHVTGDDEWATPGLIRRRSSLRRALAAAPANRCSKWTASVYCMT